MRAHPCSLLALAAILAFSASAPADPTAERGRYLVQISGCNDCHTAGYLMAPEQVPESTWLQGEQLGWSGPWGTTYASNLRLLLPKLSEDEWVALARSANYRPPMPNHVLRILADEDLRSIHRFVAQLGEAGEPAPSALPPGQPAVGPVVVFPSPPNKP